MKTQKRLLLVLSTIIVLLCLCAVPAFADNEKGLTELPPPLDPQDWALNRDQTWSDLHPNPVIKWMEDLNPATLNNKFSWDGNANRPIIGGLILVEYLDRKFISRGEVGSDPLGYYMFNQDGSGLQSEITNNPVISATEMIADEKYEGDKSKVTDADFAQWWADFFNKPQEINNYVTINEYWRENSYGRWAVDLVPFGPITIPYFEFEMTGSYKTYREAPPSFRSGSSGTSLAASFDSVAIPLARDKGAPFSDLDFFFLLHAGYDQSGVWQEFGQAQFATRQDIPYELGPGPRMLEVEAFFTAEPEWLTTYEARYRNTPSGSFWKGELDKYNALAAEGKGNEYVFHLTQEDWDWVDSYNDLTQKNTRYVSFTCWIAANSEWSHMSTANATATGAGRSIRYSTQGECDGMSTFAHEFGHISGIGDNYGTPWTNNYSPATEPWEIMSRGSFAGPGGDHARWTVPGVEAGSVPVHFMQRSKNYNQFYDDGDVLIKSVEQLSQETPLVTKIVARNIPLNNNGLYPQLEEKYGLISPNYYKAIQLNFGSGAWADQAVQKSTGWTWSRSRATNMSVEVVQRTGYDSYLNSDGVLLARNGGSPFTEVIDSHLYDIAMIDYELNGEFTPYPMAHAAQLADAAFHVGLSSVDTGYYATEYDPEGEHYNEDRPIYYDNSYNRIWTKDMLQVGSIFKGEEQGNRKVVSGDTVNEFLDPYNKLHFYILEKHTTEAEYGDFLSYTVGVLRTDGVAVGGELEVAAGELISAVPGLIAKQDFTITNTGEATDIIRVTLSDIDFPVTLQNNLFAIDPGETITVPVYVEIPFETDVDNMVGQSLIFTASSESNALKVGTAAVSTFDLVVGGSTNVRLVTDANLVKSGDYFHAIAYFRELADSNAATLEFVFDTTKFDYRGYTMPEGVELLNTVVTETGVKFTVMKRDYAAKDIIDVLLSAKEDIDLAKDVNEIKLLADYVIRVDGEKVVKSEVVSTVFTSYPKEPIEGEYNLIALSNLIDVFGMKNTHPDWNDYRFYDFNKNNMIDIFDISTLASKI